MVAARPYANARAVDDCPTIFAVGDGMDAYHEPKLKLVRANHRMQDYTLDLCIGEHSGIYGQSHDWIVSSKIRIRVRAVQPSA